MSGSTIFSRASVTPDLGTYAPGKTVRLALSLFSARPASVQVEMTIFRGLVSVGGQIQTWTLQAGENRIEFSYQPTAIEPAGYGVEVVVQETGDTGKRAVIRCETAFDVLNDWTEFPRYGFLCDFKPDRKNADETLATLTRFHLNGLQFYDWQYRHDSLVPPETVFEDPLGRPLSLMVMMELLNAAHAHGMKAMPYLAIYAASAAFWHAHPEMALYDEQHQTIPFGEEFLGIMNPQAGGAWSRHLLGECRHVLDILPFDGLHIDQYGEPKTGCDEQGRPVDLPEAFADFVTAAAAQHPGAPVLFNAVGNWPIDSLAKAPVAFNYIEIWPPKTGYTDLTEIVRNARRLSGQKPVVIALYIPAGRPVNNRLADAMIFSAGGTRIEVGEDGRLLSDPYFPRHEALDAELSERLRRQIELIVRYGNWISPRVAETEAPEIDRPVGIETFFRRTAQGASLSLVNLAAPQPLHWNEDHAAPAPFANFTVRFDFSQPVKQVRLVSPDFDSLHPMKCAFGQDAQTLSITVPSLQIWDVLLIETGPDRL